MSISKRRSTVNSNIVNTRKIFNKNKTDEVNEPHENDYERLEKISKRN